MPRAPSNYSIVREIRKRLGLTQAELAKRLGVIRPTINKIENDELDIPRRLALALSNFTGVHFGEILSNRPGEPRTWHGQPLEECFAGVQFTAIPGKTTNQVARELAQRHVEVLIKNVGYRAELILKAAMRAAPTKLWTLDAAIEIAFDDLEKEFGLQETVKRLRKIPAPHVGWIKKKVGPSPDGVFQEAQEALSGRSVEDRAARKLAWIASLKKSARSKRKEKPATSLPARSSKKRKRQAS
jgi:transcriptional regulator with XRE-family HTH domain